MPPHPLGALAPLTAYAQFIVVLLVPLPDGKVDKLPIDHRTGNVTPKGSGGAHDPSIWLDFDTASGIAASWGAGFGVGFVLTETDPFVCVDIDSCLQPDGTSWSPLALELCAALPGAVVEVSQSGSGLHIWCRSITPIDHGKKNVALGLEFYSSKRFILLGSGAVGTMANDCPGIRDVAARYFPPSRASDIEVPDDGPCAEWSGPADDDELIEIAKRSASARSAFGGATFAELWAADPGALGRRWPADGRAYDASSADMALAQHLAFFTGRDAGRIDRLMRRSGLVREKYDRADYLPRTIATACGRQRDVYSAGKRAEQPPAPAASAPLPVTAGRRFSLMPEDPLNGARALIERRFTHPDGPCLKFWQGMFYRWSGSHWVEMTEADARALLYDFLDQNNLSFYRPTQSKVSVLLDALKHAPGVHIDSTHAAAPCWLGGDEIAPASELVACANGLLHLPTRRILPPTPRFFNMNATPFAYDPNAQAPRLWLQFLSEVWPNDPEAIATLQELFGYLLTPDTRQQKIFLLVGPKRSGKGTIARILGEMLGAENVAGPTLESMTKDFGLQPLLGKLVAIISDARLGGRADQKSLAESLLRISGEDRVDVGRKGIVSITLRLGVRFVMMTNELPRIADASGAMSSRFVILKIEQSFFGREDHGLTEKLRGELPSILAWAVEGWHRLNARGYFVEPKSSAGAAQELADLGSPIGAFIREECTCAPHVEVEVSKLFLAWTTWCANMGIHNTGTQQTFGRDLRAVCPSITQTQPRVGGERVRFYRGVALTGTRWNAIHPIAVPAAPIPDQ